MKLNQIFTLALCLLLVQITSAQVYQFSSGHGTITQLRTGNLSVMEALEKNNVEEIVKQLIKPSDKTIQEVKAAAAYISVNYQGKTEVISSIINANETAQAYYLRTYFKKEGERLVPLYQIRVLFEGGTSEKIKKIIFISPQDLIDKPYLSKEANEDLARYKEYLKG